MMHERTTVYQVESYDEFRVGATFEPIRGDRCDMRTDGVVIVDLAIDYSVNETVGGMEWLFAVRCEIVDR